MSAASIARESRRRRKSKSRTRMRERLRAVKEQPCADCGIDSLPWEIMQLDHVHGEKVCKVTEAMRLGSTRFEIELAKCEPRCPNCHALRHFQSREE